MVVVDVVGGHKFGGAAVGDSDEGVVAGRVERVAVVPQLDHHIGTAEQRLQAAQLGGGPGRPLGNQGGGDDPFTATGQYHPVIGNSARKGPIRMGQSAGRPLPQGGQVGNRPRPDGGEGLEVHRRPPFFPRPQMRHRQGSAQPAIAGGVPGQDQEVGSLRIGYPVLGAGQPEGQLGAEYRRHPHRSGRLGETDHPVHAIVVGDGQGLQAQAGGFFDQLLRMGSPVEEAEVRVTVQLGVRHRALPSRLRPRSGQAGADRSPACTTRPGCPRRPPEKGIGRGAAGQRRLEVPPWHRGVVVTHPDQHIEHVFGRSRSRPEGCRPDSTAILVSLAGYSWFRYQNHRARSRVPIHRRSDENENTPGGRGAVPGCPTMATFITRFDTSAGAGLKVAVKDLIDLAGVPTTNGSAS